MIELKLIDTFPCEVLAVDEVGRGPLSGPVVVGAVRLNADSKESLQALLKYLKPKGIKDSKKLTLAQRLNVLKKLGMDLSHFRQKGVTELKGIKISYVTWDICHESIDKENILAASLRGMKEAGQFLSETKNYPTYILIDGHMKLRWGSETSPWIEHPIVKGDSKSLLIGMASIVAKEKRDAYMRDMHELYPQYGFDAHFGYPTAKHRKAIEEYGPCPIHRKSFKGVKEFVSAPVGN